ncbi:MAG: enoyl-CoA hydratase/isomerase family protein [Pseudomonadota bacterium]
MSDISIRIEGRAGRITLTRPEALNALTYDMLRTIGAALEAWRDDPAVALVLIDAEGEKAFAAGGDIRDLYRTGRAGDFAFGRQFWADEYRLNAAIANYPKPYIAIMHGIVMGGGVGVSALGSHRIVTDGSLVAMPECGIGLVPDVGGSLLLARAPGHLGAYLGMTSARMGPADAIFAGFADYYVAAERLAALKARLIESGDPVQIGAFATPPPSGSLTVLRPAIDRVFGAETVREIREGLIVEASDWADGALKALGRNCPLSVACTLAMVRRAKGFSRVEQALAQEYRFIWRCMEEGEFLEGIRAAVIDKDRSPRWARPRLDEITEADVARMLAPPPGGDLTFPG